jgi:DNA-directed RNA polymerase subunit RPC12/RpoP
MADYDYFLHYIFRLSENHLDHLLAVSGSKGFGKSTLSIWLAIKYLKFFGYKCPNCGKEFYKNLWKMDSTSGERKFYIPKEIMSGKWKIRCPDTNELDLKTGVKRKVSGCGHIFSYSELKRIKWDPRRFIAYDNSDVINKIFSLPMGSVLICDEAINFGSSMDFAKTDSKELKKLFTVIRPKRLLIFFNIPEFTWLDAKYRENLVTFWLRGIERGTAIIFEKDKGESKEKFHMKELEKTMGVVKYMTNTEKIKRNLKKHPCYFDTIHFAELPEKIYEEYELVRNARTLQRQMEELELSNKDLAKLMTYNLIRNWDSLKIAVDNSKEKRLTYNILMNEILTDPLTRKKIASDTTARLWVTGVENYIKSRGKDVGAFSVTGKDEEQKEIQEAPAQIVDKKNEVVNDAGLIEL